jgi:hypothetical protein
MVGVTWTILSFILTTHNLWFGVALSGAVFVVAMIFYLITE